MALLGVPYGESVVNAAEEARSQAQVIATDLESSGGPRGLAEKEVVALIAYMQRLGKDIQTLPSQQSVSNAAASGGSQ